MRRSIFMSLCLLAGCGAAPLPPGAMPVLVHAPEGVDARVGTYVSSPEGFSTSCHWLEGPTRRRRSGGTARDQVASSRVESASAPRPSAPAQ